MIAGIAKMDPGSRGGKRPRNSDDRPPAHLPIQVMNDVKPVKLYKSDSQSTRTKLEIGTNDICHGPTANK